MVNVTIMDPATHAGLRATTGRHARLGEGRHFVEITPREIAHTAIIYPVLVTKNADNGAFLLGAVLGIDQGENLFLGDMESGDAYRPLQLQREGFWIAQDQLAADLDHPRFTADTGEELFDGEGAPTAFLQGVAEALRELRSGAPAATAFLGALASIGLLAPVDIDLSFDDGTRRTLEDLYSIDQDALRGLDDAAALDLFRRGYLQLVYLMIASLKNVPRLARRKNDHLGR